jgi:uncharacterized membrane protein
MTTSAHLWAVGFDNVARAGEVRHEIAGLADQKWLILLDTAVVVRGADGTVTLDGEPFMTPVDIRGRTVASFLAGLALAAPLLTGTAVSAVQGAVGNTASAAAVGISADFIREVEGLMKPGTSALFVLDEQREMAAILHAIRGLGGTVIRTNVDPEGAKLIQSALSAGATNTIEPSDQR